MFGRASAVARLLRRCRARLRQERGATGVEYALAVSVFVLASVGAIDHLEDATENEYESSAAGIEALPGNDGFGGGGSPTSAVPTLPPTTTTVVDSGPTTTAGGGGDTTTTTTGGATTTTTAVPLTVITAVTDVSVSHNGGKWTAKAQVQLRNPVTQEGVPGLVVVSFSAANGSTRTAYCLAGTSGQCTATWAHRRNKHNPVVATVVNVVSSPAWDGNVVAAELTKP